MVDGSSLGGLFQPMALPEASGPPPGRPRSMICTCSLFHPLGMQRNPLTIPSQSLLPRPTTAPLHPRLPPSTPAPEAGHQFLLMMTPGPPGGGVPHVPTCAGGVCGVMRLGPHATRTGLRWPGGLWLGPY